MTQEGNCPGKDFSQIAITNHCAYSWPPHHLNIKYVSIELLQWVDELTRWLMSCHGLLTLDNHLIFTNIKVCKLYCCNDLFIWRYSTVICFWFLTTKQNIACAFWFIARHLNINAARKKVLLHLFDECQMAFVLAFLTNNWSLYGLLTPPHLNTKASK